MAFSPKADDAQKSSEKNFNLTEADFNSMIEELKSGNDQLYQEVIIGYFPECTAYLKQSMRISPTEAYDATVDTMVLFSRKLREDKIRYGNLRFLFAQMAKQAYLQKKRMEKPLVTLQTAGEVVESFEGPDQEILLLLDNAWKHLEVACQKILRAVFYDNISLNDLAVVMEKNAAAVRKQKQRCTEKLRQIFTTLEKQ